QTESPTESQSGKRVSIGAGRGTVGGWLCLSYLGAARIHRVGSGRRKGRKELGPGAAECGRLSSCKASEQNPKLKEQRKIFAQRRALESTAGSSPRTKEGLDFTGGPVHIYTGKRMQG
ncbi:hypothetical protein H1C71_007467, partial [Ictidomys tridecemlineatus]